VPPIRARKSRSARTGLLSRLSRTVSGTAFFVSESDDHDRKFLVVGVGVGHQFSLFDCGRKDLRRVLAASVAQCLGQRSGVWSKRR
jgi:hypothetical protein